MSASKLVKSYRKGAVEVPVLRGVDLKVHEGEFLAIIGQSGSGKSTLLHLLGTLDQPDAGQVRMKIKWNDQVLRMFGPGPDLRRIDNVPRPHRDWLRNRMFGMVFQFYHLLPELSALENVLSPLMIQNSWWSYFWNRRQHVEHARELLRMVGLEHRLKHRPRELSGGEMQRAAIARALVGKPAVLLADEPTGNLDRATGGEIMRILANLNRQQNLTIVMVTHDLGIAQHAHRVVRLVEGRIESA